jgi:hypothetical protein
LRFRPKSRDGRDVGRARLKQHAPKMGQGPWLQAALRNGGGRQIGRFGPGRMRGKTSGDWTRIGDGVMSGAYFRASRDLRTRRFDIVSP